MKALAIGSHEFVRFFRLLGFVGEEASEDNLVSKVAEAARSEYGIILVDSSLTSEYEHEISRLASEAKMPLILISPPFKVKETPEAIKGEVMKYLRLG